MNNRLYSIVVPIYGIEKYLDKCVQSLISQTYKNLEIILVDDGSKDNAPFMCDEYKKRDNRIRVIHKTNGGLVSARKAGAEIAQGEYIFCVDGDDWVSLDYVEEFHKVIENYYPDMICCSYYQSTIDVDTPVGFSIDAGYYDNMKIKEKIESIAIEDANGVIFPPQLWAKCFKKDLYVEEQLSVDSKIKIGEDGAVVKPILTKIKSLYILDECIYYYRYNTTSMTKSKSVFDWNGPRLIHKHLVNSIDINSGDYSSQILRRTVHDIYTVTCSRFNRGGFFAARKDIVKNISESDYSTIIKSCKFKSPKLKFELAALRYRLILLIYLVKAIGR